MNINRKNYEAYFLDYRENNLSTEQVAELMVFLEENPDLKPEFDSFENIVLQPEKNISFSKKEALKKTTVISTKNIDSDNYDEKLVAILEGDISEEESAELSEFMELNPKVKLEYNLYRSTILKPDTNVFYSDKESLKKKGLFVLYRTQLVYGLSIAASIIILLGVYFGFLNQQTNRSTENSLSNLKNIKIIKPEIKIAELVITEIQKKNNFSAKSISIQPTTETNLTERENLKIAGIDSQEIKGININGENPDYLQFIEIRQTTSDAFAMTSVNEPIIVEDQKPNKTFFKRWPKVFRQLLLFRVIHSQFMDFKSNYFDRHFGSFDSHEHGLLFIFIQLICYQYML